MKKVKRVLALLAAFALVLAMAVPAWAEGNTGSITVQGAVNGESYSIYKIFDVTGYDMTTNPHKITYKVTDGWASFFAKGNPGATYVTLDSKKQISATTLDSTNAPAFAAAAITWAKDSAHNIKVTDSKTANKDGVTFTNVADGYYLVDTSLGALCSLDNVTGNTAKISEKNKVPSVEKKVKSGDVYESSNSAKIGDTVEYKTTITINGSVEKVVLHDKMGAGLTFNETSVKVKVGVADVAEDNYTLKKPGTESSDSCTFEIEFKDSYIAGLAAGTQIEVTYSATLNESAVIGTTGGNKNDTWLKYGNSGSVTSETTTYSYSFDLVKTDSDGTLLAGAKFKLYADQDCTSEIKLVADGTNGYRVATTGETGVPYIETNANSALTIKGLKGTTTYYLKEIEAPKGYNELENAFKFTIESANISSNLSETSKKWDEVKSTGIHIINNAGTTLPSTGGMGTTVFYVVGGGLMAVAVVLLVTKKRMENKR